MLTGKQRRYLRSIAHDYRSIIQVGKNGINANLIDTLESALNAHELVKINVLQNCMDNIKELAADLAETTNSEIVNIIGRTIVFYRESEKKLIEIK